MTSVKTRFAPSPTGLIHLGNARTALFNVLYARATGGSFLLRIEDTDAERSASVHVADLMQDFAWLGLEWQEGPRQANAEGPYFQSCRGDIYEAYYRQLEQEGRAYPCFCSPKELELSRRAQLGAGQPPRYSGKCAHLSEDEAAAKIAAGATPTLRFRVPPEGAVEYSDRVRGPQRFQNRDIGDFIIRRADGTPAFFFCNAVDDALMGVTLVLRGEDHLTNTPRQILILEALGLPLPDYGHISLILGDDGAPLSKRNGSQSLQDLYQRGYIAGAVLNYLARLGHRYEDERCLSLDQLAAGFRLEALGRAPARFDPAQLLHWQKEAVQQADDASLLRWLGEAIGQRVPSVRQGEFLDLVRSNCVFPAEARDWAEILFGDAGSLDTEMQAIVRAAGPDFFQAAAAAAESWPGDFKAFSGELKNRTGAKGKSLFQPLRAALTGRLDGPEIARVYALLEADRIQQRFAAAQAEGRG